jgi:hypothetical protein
MKTKELNAAQIADLTGHSRKQIIRYAKSDKIPGHRRITGNGPGTGYVFEETAELESWIQYHTLCTTARLNVGPGRKSKAAYKSLDESIDQTVNAIRYEYNWEKITDAISMLSAHLPKKVRKIMSLRNFTPKRLFLLERALSPIFKLQNDITVRLYDMRNKKNPVVP